ncbi:MAG: DUF3231 family protein [Firmicutes bacterium]|nr:DUF3231 family protein [Bacillota bacterium]
MKLPFDISLFKKSATGSERVSAVETFNVWSMLRDRYISIETYQLFINLVHDRDFVLLLNNHLKSFKKQINELETLSKKHKVKVTARPPEQIKFSASIDSVTDKRIYRRITFDLVAELYSLNRSVRSSLANDQLRNTLINFLFNHLDNYEKLYKYGKLKGWSEIEPAYKTGKVVDKEPISVSEAGHIWEHIDQRYDQIQLTNYYINFIHDTEFKKMLEIGVKGLETQLKQLVEKANEYEIPLPERPPKSQVSTIDSETIEDRFVYRTIQKAMQNVIDLHIRAVVETLRNDNLRGLFLSYLKDELDLYDEFVKYGKLKGWLRVEPMYEPKS